MIYAVKLPHAEFFPFAQDFVIEDERVTLRVYEVRAMYDEWEALPGSPSLGKPSPLPSPGKRSIADEVASYEALGWDYEPAGGIVPGAMLSPLKLVGVEEVTRLTRAFPLNKSDWVATNVQMQTGETQGFIVSNPVMSAFPSLVFLPNKDGATSWADGDFILGYGRFGFRCNLPVTLLPETDPLYAKAASVLRPAN
jgi:hypothetical protein